MKVPEQPEVNIGMIGHVDHGKTTLTKALTGEWTDRHSEEIKRGISIRLGYADVAFYKCSGCEPPISYTNDKTCRECGGKAEFLRSVSFVDAPGHETLMATMLSGAAMMHGALLLIAANEQCPQPQTKEHLMALTIIGVDRIIIVQNKIDLVTREEALDNYKQVKAFVKGTIAENAPIIPVSAHHDVNIDKLIEAIETYIPTPALDAHKPARMFVARSFDINVPGSSPETLKGGVLGGSLIQGKLEIGDEIEISPGRKVEGSGGKIAWESVTTTVESLHAGGTALERAKPGGLIAIGTKLDPSLT
ncbi:MAG: translation initiation factor IF-2 subunit gamma, partial [Euryarchaeota archaeon]|nr:translation initiation factor IF-2 subunit gamma [Euryarchaeota archaeon]